MPVFKLAGQIVALCHNSALKFLGLSLISEAGDQQVFQKMQIFMDFFISTAHAQGAQQGSPLGFFLPLLVIFAAFYFLLIRPQQKRQKTHNQMVNGLSPGDDVLTAGGILGTVTAVSDHYITLRIADNVEIKIQKSTISAVVPKGTFDAA